MENKHFTWGETVRIVLSAPETFRPGKLAEVCSIWEIESEENSLSLGEPVGSVIYSIEFGDGKLMDIPERYLEKYIEA